MKIQDYKVGTTFEENCVVINRKDGTKFYNHFGIIERFASIYGDKPEDIIKVRATIIEEDVVVKDLIASGYDLNTQEYFAWIDFENDGTYNIRLIYGNIKLYIICFPYGPDIERFYNHESRDIKTHKVIHKPGDRRGMTVKLKIEEI